jgi:3-hydroxyisobutyrate dehydrogenase-like beta-hydroxyacid dehydrogenase
VSAAGNSLRIAFIGFGEVGQAFARGLRAQDGISITAFDLLMGQRNPMVAVATALGVTPATTAAKAALDAQIVISAVTASQAEAVAREAAAFLTAGQMFVDVNSAAPATKQRAARYVEAAGAHYIECAVMQPVMKPGLAVPILAGGPHAVSAAARLNGLGMNVTPVSTTFGRASAMKLCRSIMIKGLEALMVDCAAACEGYGVKEPVFASLAETFPSIDWHALSDNMRERVATHGVRRSAEMREAAEMLAELGLAPDLAKAVADAQLRGVRPKADGA